MKTEKEIREKIEYVNRIKDNYTKAYKDKEISEKVLVNRLIDLDTTINTLMWVLGKDEL